MAGDGPAAPAFAAAAAAATRRHEAKRVRPWMLPSLPVVPQELGLMLWRGRRESTPQVYGQLTVLRPQLRELLLHLEDLISVFVCNAAPVADVAK